MRTQNKHRIHPPAPDDTALCTYLSRMTFFRHVSSTFCLSAIVAQKRYSTLFSSVAVLASTLASEIIARNRPHKNSSTRISVDSGVSTRCTCSMFQLALNIFTLHFPQKLHILSVSRDVRRPLRLEYNGCVCLTSEDDGVVKMQNIVHVLENPLFQRVLSL